MVGARKLLKFYICFSTANNRHVRKACEGQRLQVECRNGRIKIHEVMYGRQNRHVCRDGNANNSNCKARHAHPKVTNKCENNRNCNVPASNNFFGDPCPGTSKYLEVHYSCR